MAHTTIIGALGKDPELRYTSNGKPIANCNIAWSERYKDHDQWVDGPTTWVRVSCSGRLAENAGKTLEKGNWVIATGNLRKTSWQDKNGQTHDQWEMWADNLGVSLHTGVITIAKRQKTQTDNNPGGFQNNNPWGQVTNNNSYTDNVGQPPF